MDGGLGEDGRSQEPSTERETKSSKSTGTVGKERIVPWRAIVEIAADSLLVMELLLSSELWTMTPPFRAGCLEQDPHALGQWSP